jgi:hypothetical protein
MLLYKVAISPSMNNGIPLFPQALRHGQLDLIVGVQHGTQMTR